MQEARFDRHYVREMTWSRHQLEELAEQRFAAAQERFGNGGGNGGGNGKPGISFSELFKEVCILQALACLCLVVALRG